MNWTVEYYMDSRGNEPVADFLDSLPIEVQVKVFRLIDLLGNYGVLLTEPYTRKIKGKLRELRITDRAGQVRIIYFTYTNRRFVLLHGFVKKTRETLRRDIGVSEKRLKDFINRQGGER